ncbi:hypothetical protein DM860_001078 [Cuscuta australis]|uniref:HAT C-terminal dimerisation domain-containing protein n=1 Tax=Cuscuta australis TaxID=267555 RepID=A0A328DW93_9ASTE|nr:hypothetical protein DM860_001078 [Cuscuta australis]
MKLGCTVPVRSKSRKTMNNTPARKPPSSPLQASIFSVAKFRSINSTYADTLHWTRYRTGTVTGNGTAGTRHRHRQGSRVTGSGNRYRYRHFGYWFGYLFFSTGTGSTDKNSYYYSYLVEWKNERDNAITLFEDLFKEYQGLYGTVQEETAPPPPPKSKKGFASIVGGLLAKKGKRAQSSTSSSGTTVSSHNELAMYQGVPCDYDDDDVDFDVLGWWKRNEHMFPCLGMLARQVLSVPVSTVAVEREFSAGGNILTDYRSCLNAESLETLVCNQDWLLARRRAQESSYQLESEHYMNATTDGSPSSEE